MPYPEIHYRWEYHLSSSPELLWPLVSDTDRFNHVTGVPPVEAMELMLNKLKKTQSNIMFLLSVGTAT